MQNESIAAYMDSMEKKKAELYGKYKAVNKKYEAMRNRAAPPQTCEEKLKAVDEAQRGFLNAE